MYSYNRIKLVDDILDDIGRFKKHFLIIVNRKKRFISVKDGFITYTVKLSDFRCQCPGNGSSKILNFLCEHNIYILTHHFGVPVETIAFLDDPNILSKVVQQIKKGTIQNSTNLFNDILKEKSCGICLDDFRINKNLFLCTQCKNYVHAKCMEKWMTSHTKNMPNVEKGCIYCKS
jgi:hypothetical protein